MERQQKVLFGNTVEIKWSNNLNEDKITKS